MSDTPVEVPVVDPAERRSGADRRVVNVGPPHPPVSDPAHPDHAQWQHENAGAPSPDDQAAIAAAIAAKIEADDLEALRAAEARVATDAAQAEAAAAQVEADQAPADVPPAPDGGAVQ